MHRRPGGTEALSADVAGCNMQLYDSTAIQFYTIFGRTKARLSLMTSSLDFAMTSLDFDEKALCFKITDEQNIFLRNTPANLHENVYNGCSAAYYTTHVQQRFEMLEVADWHKLWIREPDKSPWTFHPDISTPQSTRRRTFPHTFSTVAMFGSIWR